jgi:hypothetical protein
MTQAELYSEELKTQSIRDLELAKSLVSQKLHAEHVAWLCDQSYEKILKHVFAHFLAERGVRVEKIDDRLRRPWLAGPVWRFGAIDIVRDLSRVYFDTLLGRDMKPATGERKSRARPMVGPPMDLWNNLEASVEKIISQSATMIDANPVLSSALQNYTKEKFLDASSVWTFTGFISKLMPPDPNTSDQYAFLTAFLQNNLESIRGNFSVEGFEKATNLVIKLTKAYYGFILRAVMLAPWILPLSEASHYPMPEYNSENLKMFRDFEPQLIDYYSVVCKEIEKLIDISGHFNEALTETRKFMKLE